MTTPQHAYTSRVLPQHAPPGLMEAIEKRTRDALERHGITAFMMSREAAIVHETGHAIVAAHEGMTVRSVTIFSRSMPVFGDAWGGWCNGGGAWMTGPDSSVDDDLSRARIVIAGLAGEAVTRQDLPGSSIDELALSQLLGHNAAVKLQPPGLNDAEYWQYAERLWHEQVWNVTIEILLANHEPFNCLAQALHEKEKVKGPRLRKVLAQVKGIAA